MGSVVLFATLFLCQSDSALDQSVSQSVEPAPAVQEVLIDLKAAESPTVGQAEIDGEETPGIFEDSGIDPFAEPAEPIEKSVEPLDEIVPIFADEVEAAPLDLGAPVTQPVEPVNVENGPMDRDAERTDAPQPAIDVAAGTPEPSAKYVAPEDWVPSVSEEGVKIAEDSAPVDEPQPAAIEQGLGNHDAQTAEPETGTSSGTVPGADQEVADETANTEPVNGPATESTDRAERDADSQNADEPIVGEDVGVIPDPQPEATEGQIGEPVPTTLDARPSDVVEPDLIQGQDDRNLNVSSALSGA